MNVHTLSKGRYFRNIFLWLFSAVMLAGCSQLDALPYLPTQTPETWLKIQPFMEFQLASKTILVVQPSTTIIVYLLGLVTIGAGFYFLSRQNAQHSRFWWGIALLFWGIGALLAGTSYEAFSYQIKCAGREVCIWTNWWEVCYLLLSVASVNAMLMAQAYSSAKGKLRRILLSYAVINFSVYAITVLVGSLIPVKFLISFELLILVCAPSIVILLILNSWRYQRYKQKMDLRLLGVWIWLMITIAAYFLYLISGLTQILWARGFWFSENDVLHIGLILWMVYIALVADPYIIDEI